MATHEEMMPNYASFIERVLDVEEEPRTEFIPVEGYQNQALLPLDAVTQRLTGIISSISHDLSIARERTSTLPTDNLNHEESTAIYLYTMGKMSSGQSLYECLNMALRAKDQTVLSPYLPFLKLFLTALSKLESMGQTIFRGAKTDLSEKYSVGKTFVWSGFSSCLASVQLLSSEQFFGETEPRTLFTIHCLNGRDIRQYSSSLAESEIILLPDTKFKVLSKLSPSTNFHLITIQEIASSNMLRQGLLSDSTEINEFRFIETSALMMNAYNYSKNLIKKIDEQRDKTEGNFSSMSLNDEQTRLIANEIKININWKLLNLNTNKIGVAGMSDISAALVLNSTLETLSLDNNYIGDYGIGLLTDALTQNFTLVNLTLSRCHVKENGAKSLALLLRTNFTLTDLSLEDNIIGDNGMIALCETLEQYNRTLKRLCVDENSISDRSVEAIVAFRTVNNTLKDFTIDGNRFSRQALNTLKTAFRKHEEIIKSLPCIDEVAVICLEMGNLHERRFSREASVLFTDFRRIHDAKALERIVKMQTNKTIYLILCCTDDNIVRVISSFSVRNKILLYVLGLVNTDLDKNTNVFSSEDTMIFRLTTRIAARYRSLGDQAVQMSEKGKAQIYFQQSIDIQQKLVTYLKKRRINPVKNQNDT